MVLLSVLGVATNIGDTEPIGDGEHGLEIQDVIEYDLDDYYIEDIDDLEQEETIREEERVIIRSRLNNTRVTQQEIDDETEGRERKIDIFKFVVPILILIGAFLLFLKYSIYKKQKHEQQQVTI